MSHIFGNADSSTVTSNTGLHQPSSPNVAQEISLKGETGTVGYGTNNVFGNGGYDNSKPAISQQQLDFYNHSLAVAFGGGSFSTAPMVAPTHQSSPARLNAALVQCTMKTGVSELVNGGGGELAPAVSPASAIASVSPAFLSCQTTPAVTVSPSTTWSGTSSGAAVPHAIPGNYFTPASSGGGIEFCQDGAIGGQRQQLQQEQQLEDKRQQQWLAGPGSSLDPTNSLAMSTYSPSSVPFSPLGQHMLQPAMFQAPHPHLPGVSSSNASTGTANSTVPYQLGLAPASRQFSQPNGGGNMGDLGASAMVTHPAPPTFTAGTTLPGVGIVLPTPAPQHQPSSPYGVIPPAAMLTPASFGGLGFGNTVAGGRGTAGCFAQSYGPNGIGAAGAAITVAGANDSKQAGSHALLAAQQQQLQLRTTAPMFTVSAPPHQNMFTASNSHVPGGPKAMIDQAAAAEAVAAQAGLPVVPFPVNAFLQLNPLYPGLRRLLESPPVYVVDDFFSHPECDALMALANNYMIISPVVGAGAGEISESRTSSSCFLAREDLPTVCRKVMALSRKPLEHLELPQVGRYYTTQKYSNHWDAFDLGTEDGRRFAQNGGQRVCTVLVYLNDVLSGGCTSFPRLGLRVQPRKGMAVVFFPATLDGTLDPMLLHAAEPAIDTKWVSQIWIRQGAYHGTPTARIPRI